MKISDKELEIELYVKPKDEFKISFKNPESMSKKRIYQIFIDIEYIGAYHRNGEKAHTSNSLQFYDTAKVRVSSKS